MLVEVRCRKCGKLLFRTDSKAGTVEIACQRCSVTQTVQLTKP